MKKIMLWICTISMVAVGMLQLDFEMKASTSTYHGERMFYHQLNNDQKHVYDTIVASANVEGGLMSGTAKIPINMSSFFTSTSANDSEISTYLTSLKLNDVNYAITRDHPDLFWLHLVSVGYSKTYDQGELIIYLDPSTDYYLAGFTSEEQVKQIKVDLDEKVNQIVSVCKTSDRYQTLSCVNNWLIENNKYNTAAATNSSVYEQSWSAMSGLLSNNDASKGPVCYGYAMAFKLICDRLGIPCIEVEGEGWLSDSVSESHAWNYVQMLDGKWYAVDTTWNDVQTVVEQKKYFLVGSDTFSLNHVQAERNYPILSTDAYAGTVAVAQIGDSLFTSLQDAIDVADGKVIDLLDEIDVTQPLEISSNIAINARGNSIINRTDTTVSPIIQITEQGKLSLYDDVDRLAIPGYLGDVVQLSTVGTLIENKGTLELRSIQLESDSILVSGIPYTLGSHSKLISQGKGYINVGEIKKPTINVDDISVSTDDLLDKTTSGLLEYIKLDPPLLTYSYVKGGSVLSPNVPTWSIKDSGILVEGQTYELVANVYGYELTVPVHYGSEIASLTGTIKITGKAQPGETISVDVSELTQSNLGILSYVWKCNEVEISGASTNTYLLKASDVGKTITVAVSSENYSGTIMSEGVLITNPEPNPDLKPDPTPNPEPNPDLKPDPTPNPEPNPDLKPDPTPNPEPNPDLKPDPTPNPEPNPALKPDPTPNPDVGKEIIIENEDGSIKVQGELPDGLKIVSFELSKDKLIENVAKIKDEGIKSKYNFEKAFNIILQENGMKYELKSKVFVTIKLSDALLDKELSVFYMNDNGNVEEVDSYMKGDELTFETTHFSTYAIVSKVNASEKDQGLSSANTGEERIGNVLLMCIVCSGAILILLKKRKV